MMSSLVTSGQPVKLIPSRPLARGREAENLPAVPVQSVHPRTHLRHEPLRRSALDGKHLEAQCRLRRVFASQCHHDHQRHVLEGRQVHAELDARRGLVGRDRRRDVLDRTDADRRSLQPPTEQSDEGETVVTAQLPWQSDQLPLPAGQVVERELEVGQIGRLELLRQ